MVIKPSPLITHARGLVFGALSIFGLSVPFHVPTAALLGLAIIGSITLIAAVRYPAWQWLIFFALIFIQIIGIRLLEGNNLAFLQCLVLQIGSAAAVLLMQGVRPTLKSK